LAWAFALRRICLSEVTVMMAYVFSILVAIISS
jgi:hypothetical protein